MIKHNLIKKLSSEDEYMVAISYIKHNDNSNSGPSLETTVFTNDFPLEKMTAARVEYDKLIRQLERKLDPERKQKIQKTEALNNQIKGLIE